MRIALHSVIRDGLVDDYRTSHSRVPDELVALFERAGIHDWVIWRSGNRLFHLVECDDWTHAMTVVGPHPANERWQTQIGRFVDSFRGPEGDSGYEPLALIWTLAAQKCAEREGSQS